MNAIEARLVFQREKLVFGSLRQIQARQVLERFAEIVESEDECTECDGTGRVECECDECGDVHEKECPEYDGDGVITEVELSDEALEAEDRRKIWFDARQLWLFSDMFDYHVKAVETIQ